MKILVISDLHIDTGDRLGTFHWNESEFIMYLEHLRREYYPGRIILNGDIFELLRYKYEDIRAAYPHLVNYLADKDFIYLRGNHDAISNTGQEQFNYINSSGQSIHIEHGHNADWFNGSIIGRVVGRAGFSLLKILSGNRFLIDLFFQVVRFSDADNRIPKKYNNIKYLTYALRLLKMHDVVILAHTHKLESHHTYYHMRKKRYLNCGTCSLGRFQGILIDTETLRYDFINETRESVAEKVRAKTESLFFRKGKEKFSPTAVPVAD
jgi:predicted phosphodiesterase